MDPRVKAVKLFHDQGALFVALFGDSTPESDGWIRNLPASEVFLQIPPPLPVEQLIPVADIQSQIRSSTPREPKTVPFSASCRAIAARTKLPERQVKRICSVFLQELEMLIRKGESFRSPILLGEAMPDTEGSGPTMKLRLNPENR